MDCLGIDRSSFHQIRLWVVGFVLLVVGQTLSAAAIDDIKLPPLLDDLNTIVEMLVGDRVIPLETFAVDMGDGKIGYAFSLTDPMEIFDESNVKMASIDGLNGLLNPDPIVTYNLAVTNFSASAIPFSFVFSTTIVPVGPANIVDASLSGTMQDGGAGFGADGSATIAPVGTSVAMNTVDDGFGPVNMGVDVGPSVTNGGGSSTYPTSGSAFMAGPIPGPIPTGPAWTTLTANVNFTLSARDSATLTGYAQIVPVPVPAAGWIGIALLGIVGVITKTRSIRTSG